jgi:hypothetical protein
MYHLQYGSASNFNISTTAHVAKINIKRLFSPLPRWTESVNHYQIWDTDAFSILQKLCTTRINIATSLTTSLEITTSTCPKSDSDVADTFMSDSESHDTPYINSVIAELAKFP